MTLHAPFSSIGKPTSRIDGYDKVTGRARYAAEFNMPGLLHGYVASSPIAKGRIKSIDRAASLAVPGVVEIFTHENRPKVARSDKEWRDQVAPPGSPFRPLESDRIVFSGQPIALVVAEDLETARFAAGLLRFEYQIEPHETDFDAMRSEAYEPPEKRSPSMAPAAPRGDADKALAEAPVRVAQEYRTPVEHHNPMECFGSTAIYNADGSLVIYDKTQGAPNSHDYVCNVLGLKQDQVRVFSQFVGGAFGSGLRPQYQLFLAAMAALALKRSVRVAMTRQQMFTHGYRPATLQTLHIGAAPDGELAAIKHDALAITSQFEDYQENIVNWSGALYVCGNSAVSSKLVKLDLFTPCDMRAPGGAVGAYALECAMDELAYALRMDPLELRLKTYSDIDQNEDKPYSSKALKDCYYQGAERFGWSKRKPEPRSMREGSELIGYGMATGIWEAMRQTTSAKASLDPDGTLTLSSATADIGTGTYTILAQIGAELLGLPLDKVVVKIGDSSLPQAPVEGGSWTAASAGSAVMEACQSIRGELLHRAAKLPRSPLRRSNLEDVVFENGALRLKADPASSVQLSELLAGANAPIEAEVASAPDKKAMSSYAHYTHSAIFAEVRLDEELGMLRVTRVVNAVAAGRILNPKTAGSQIMGGVVGGIGMALQEETVIDQAYGRFITHNLADYHVPVHADVYDIDVLFVDEHEERMNPLGVKGVGEIGIVGTAAAIANAVYHATGRRVRDLPITIDKLLGLTS